MAAAAVVERNVYDKATMSIAVSGETDAEADAFLKDKLCEQGLKGAPRSRVSPFHSFEPGPRRPDTPSHASSHGAIAHKLTISSLVPSWTVIEVYAEWGGRCEPLLPVLKRIQKEAEHAENCAVVLHCKAESHELLADYRGKSMPHFLFYRNGVQVAVVKGANMPEIESLLDEHAPTSPDADVLEENPMFVQRAEEKAAAEAAAQAALMGENE